MGRVGCRQVGAGRFPDAGKSRRLWLRLKSVEIQPIGAGGDALPGQGFGVDGHDTRIRESTTPASRASARFRTRYALGAARGDHGVRQQTTTAPRPPRGANNNMAKTALITGITGQDGSFLAEFLIDKGYEVHGIMRRSSSFNTGRIEHLYLDEWVRDMKKKRLVNLHWGDMTDSSSLIRIIAEVRPDEIYNLAAQSHVKVSFDVPEFTADADAMGVLRLLEAVRIAGLADTCRIYQASTSELFGMVQEVPQRETTPFYPRSPYGVAKLYGYWIIKNYRESYSMYCCNGILFNHESERRGETFVTRKITLAAARIAQGFQDKLYLGNLNALRDWGYARDYVECMWLMLQQPEPDDFVIATGEYHSVREFCTLAFKEVGMELRWEGEGVDERGIDTATGKVVVEVDPKYFRPAEVEQLLGDPSKARRQLGWNPQSTSFGQLVKIMVAHDMKKVRKLYIRQHMDD